MLQILQVKRGEGKGFHYPLAFRESITKIRPLSTVKNLLAYLLYRNMVSNFCDRNVTL